MNAQSIDPSISGSIPAQNTGTHKSVWKRCPFLRIISAIWNVVKQIFQAIKKAFSPSPYDLSAKDFEYLRNVKSRVRPSSPVDSPRTDLRKRHVSQKSTGAASPSDVNESAPDVEKVEDNPVYQDFREAAMGFIDHALEATYEEKIVDVVPTVQGYVGKFEQFMNTGADVVISIGSSLSRPLKEKLDGFKIAEQLGPDFERLIKWLLKDKETIDQAAFIERLKVKLGDIAEHDKRDVAIGHCREWLFEGDQSTPLLTPDQSFVDAAILERVFKESIVILSEQRISEFNKKVTTLNDKLPDIFKRMLMKNGHKLGGIVLDRLLQVIDKTPYTKTYKDLISLLADHSSAVDQAEKARDSAKRDERARLDRYDRAAMDDVHRDPRVEENRQVLIANREAYQSESRKLWCKVAGKKAEQAAIEAAKLRFKTLKQEEPEPAELAQIKKEGYSLWLSSQGREAREEAVRQVNAQIQSVFEGDDQDAKDSLEQQVRELWIQETGEVAAQKTYKSYTVRGERLCHPGIDELQLVNRIDQVKNGKKIPKLFEIMEVIFSQNDQEEKHLFDSSANRIIELLFPEVTVIDSHDRSRKVDGLLYLFDQIEYEHELKEIYDEATYIYDQVLTDQKQKFIVNFIRSNRERFDDCMVRYAKSEVRTAIKEAIATLFQKFIIPEKIDEMIAYDMLPAVQETIVELLAKNIISDNLNTYSPLYTRLLYASAEDKDAIREEFVDTLVARVRGNLNSFEVEDEKLKELVRNQIVELEEILRAFLDEREEQEGEDREALIRSAINSIFRNHYSGTSARYGDLVINTAFKLGGLNSTAETFAGWFKGTISREISSATHELQDSPKYLLDNATQQIRKKYGTKDTVRELLFVDREEVDAAERRQKLEEELTKTARVAHDLLMYVSNQQSWYARRPIQWVIGSTPDHLEQVIKRVYHKMFDHPLYTQNLMVKIQEKISRALQKGGNAVNASASELQVARTPTLVPSFIYDSDGDDEVA